MRKSYKLIINIPDEHYFSALGWKIRQTLIKHIPNIDVTISESDSF